MSAPMRPIYFSLLWLWLRASDDLLFWQFCLFFSAFLLHEVHQKIVQSGEKVANKPSKDKSIWRTLMIRKEVVNSFIVAIYKWFVWLGLANTSLCPLTFILLSFTLRLEPQKNDVWLCKNIPQTKRRDSPSVAPQKANEKRSRCNVSWEKWNWIAGLLQFYSLLMISIWKHLML